MILPIFAFFLSSSAIAQLVVVVDAIPANTPPDASIYLAGEINDWNPGDTDFIFEEVDGLLMLDLPENTPATFEGKLTRGDWPSAEGNQGGGYIPNRNFNFSGTDTVHITVLSWEDLGGSPTDLPPNVITLSNDFYMPELDRNRRIRLFLPTDYDDTNLDYPVLYMHDGQNLFSAQEAFAGEWEVDEALLNFESEGYTGAIVVAIDNGPERIEEYTPWANPNYGGGDGAAYIEFIVNTLKPHVDENYRTLSGRENTGIMGSSLGGLISHYGGMKYQDVFSKVGVFSPSFWFTDDIYEFTTTEAHQADMKFYFLAGGQESESLEQEVIDMTEDMMAAGFTEEELNFKFVSNGQHSEWFWAQEFPDAFEWLYMSETTGVADKDGGLNITVYPNPVYDSLHFTMPNEMISADVVVLDVNGKEVLTVADAHNKIDLSQLNAGAYIVKVFADGLSQTFQVVKM